MELTLEQKEALVRFLQNALEGASNITNAIYVSPAQALRNQANAIEQRERDYPHLQTILRELLYGNKD